MEQAEQRVWKPQPGPQTAFCACRADICFYGGQVGGGKTHGLVMDFARLSRHKGGAGVIFRRRTTELVGGGSIWNAANEVYGSIPGVEFRQTPTLEVTFPTGSTVEFRHLQHEHDVHGHQSKQYARIGFDEATQFTGYQFWYLLSRIRSGAGWKGRVRATCNPDPDSFVRGLIDWWIGEDGLPITARGGVLRYFVREGDQLIWSNNPHELAEKYPLLVDPLTMMPMSLTFIPATLRDNQALMKSDPGYTSRLLSLPQVERERLLGGNWNIRPAAGSYFKRHYFEVIDFWAGQVKRRARAWDLAATKPHEGNKNPDWTVGVKGAELDTGKWLLEHAERLRETPGGVDDALLRTAQQDGVETVQCFWRDPGQAGKSQEDHIVKLLKGYHVKFQIASKDKKTYAGPVSSHAEHGGIALKRGHWNEPFLATLEAFPTKGVHDDDVDALSRLAIEFFPAEAGYDPSYDSYVPNFRSGY